MRTHATVPAGFSFTRTPAEPATPSTVAVSRVEPDATAITMPPASTVAIPVTVQASVAPRPERTLPMESNANTRTYAVSPMSITSESGFPSTRATFGGPLTHTRTAAESRTPSTVATRVAVPAARAVTVPPGPRRATSESEIDQVTTRPPSAWLAESYATALNSAGCPG